MKVETFQEARELAQEDLGGLVAAAGLEDDVAWAVYPVMPDVPGDVPMGGPNDHLTLVHKLTGRIEHVPWISGGWERADVMRPVAVAPDELAGALP